MAQHGQQIAPVRGQLRVYLARRCRASGGTEPDRCCGARADKAATLGRLHVLIVEGPVGCAFYVLMAARRREAPVMLSITEG
ncbi:MAG: hypothetical protein QOJ85_154 [Solirubrobacteraceae bacterium]|nr:hypothetical protein [Solirubrobacteraceae bacterium]MEA2242652.1 hypothetical protein [Solirubrobacteraceae bacterium]